MPRRFRHDAFKDDSEAPSVLQSGDPLDENREFVGRSAFLPIAAFLHNSLWQHSHVTDDRNPFLCQSLYFSRLFHATFEFNSLSTSFNQEASIPDGSVISIIGMNGQVSNEQSSLAAPCGGGNVMGHVLNRDMGRIGETEDDHAQRVSYKNQVYS